MRKVGVLAPAAAASPLWQGYLAAFREELQKLGWLQTDDVAARLRQARDEV